jgi:predicted dehydrogenase
MNTVYTPIDLDYGVHFAKKLDYGIGICGAGFIVKECHLPAYKKAGFNVKGIYTRTRSKAENLAKIYGIPKVYDSFEELCDDPEIEVIDLAFPPHLQLDLVEKAVVYGKHLLCQKPLAMNLVEAKKIVKLADEAGIKLGVNQNMRYDPAMRSLKTLITKGYLGNPLVATFHLYSPGHWQTFLKDYNRLLILNLSVHHLDCFRFLFGDPVRIFASATGYNISGLHAAAAKTYDQEQLKELKFKGEIVATYIVEWKNGLRAVAIDDGFSWADDQNLDWRVEGTKGVAKGIIGWPRGGNSTLHFYSKGLGDTWYNPALSDRKWFPDAFEGTMNQLLKAIEEDTDPEISGHDNLRTMALIEAAYKSIKERRAVELNELLSS